MKHTTSFSSHLSFLQYYVQVNLLSCNTQDYYSLRVLYDNLTITTGPVSHLQLYNAELVSQQFIFSWSPVVPNGRAIHYNILASNCGSCPTTTNHTNVTCNDVPSKNSVCMFAIQTEVCGNNTGQISDPIRVNVNIAKPTINVLTGSIVSMVSLI